MQGPGKQTALMYSCLKGKSNAVSTLLDAGADVTITEKDGYGPMHGASFWGQTEVILTLLKRTDIDPLAPHSDGLIPMHRACRGGYMGTVMAIIEEDGPQGLFLRGLGTKLLTNAVSAMLFTVLWKFFEEKLTAKKDDKKKAA